VHNIHAHNDFLEVFAESGLFATVIFLLIYLFILLTLIKRSKKYQKYFPLFLTTLVTFSFSFVSFPNFKFASYFLAMVAAGVALVSLSETTMNYFRFKFNYLKIFLILCLILGGTVSYIKVKSELNYGQAILLKDRKQYMLMLQKLDGVSEIFYPLDPSKQPVEYYRGIANSYLGMHSEALQRNLAGLELAPYNPILMKNVAASYQALGNLKCSIAQYEKVHNNFPNYLSPQFNLLDLYFETGQIEKSRTLFKELKEQSPSNPVLLKYGDKHQ
jgi:tetratricopeptide (TPR) repeat protein